MTFRMTSSKTPALRSVHRVPYIQIRGVATVPFRLPAARNEPNRDYTKDFPERTNLEKALKALRAQIPLESTSFINGKAQQPAASRTIGQPLPAEHATTFTHYPLATQEQINTAIVSALAAKKDWENMPFVDRVAIFMRAAELVTGKYRYELIAATMLGQGKNIWQGEIDAAAELADFFRLNCNLAAEVLEKQPDRGSNGMWTRVDYRPLEGFVYAISPFNFTAIGGNLVTAPAIMGNVVVWKPSPSNVYASSLVYKILLEAGLPPNVIQFVTGDAEEITQTVLAHRDFAGLHFTGSSDVFRSLYSQVGQNIGKKVYRDYPRMVGETSGKNFHLVHSSADIDSAVYHTLRGSFEYQGQKCSATSRLYLPESQASKFLGKLKEEIGKITIGSPDADLEAFMGPVIHQGALEKVRSIIDSSNADSSLELVAGGTYDGSKGYYIHPTVYRAKDPNHWLFDTEVFGPVLVVYVYPDTEWSSILKQVDQSGGGFALTGAVFASDRKAVREAENALRFAAGNFYINCKTTAALIGQQSFGGSRASGTNDKAGSPNPLLRFASPRTIKEEFFPLDGFKYPSNE